MERRGVYFGHRRLSIIDLEGGNQPMQSGDSRYILVFNGEIYNFLELVYFCVMEYVYNSVRHRGYPGGLSSVRFILIDWLMRHVCL